MIKDVLHDLDKDSIRGLLNKYTRRAFRMIPKMDKPKIVDIGCGTGVGSIELAGLCDGHITAIDNDQQSLDSFKEKLAKTDFSDRIEIINRSIHDLNFPDESLDIVWCEGALFVLGFKRSLKQWRRFLKPDGYLAAHDEKGNVQNKLKQISNCGYNLIDHFVLDKNIWWEEYYRPLEKRIQELRDKYADDKSALTVLDREYNSEVGFFKKHPSRCESVCFVMKKG